MNAVIVVLLVIAAAVIVVKAGDLIMRVVKAAIKVAIALAIVVFLFLGVASTQERVYVDQYGSTCTETYGLMIYTHCDH
jgi:hypothetical protein